MTFLGLCHLDGSREKDEKYTLELLPKFIKAITLYIGLDEFSPQPSAALLLQVQQWLRKPWQDLRPIQVNFTADFVPPGTARAKDELLEKTAVFLNLRQDYEWADVAILIEVVH